MTKEKENKKNEEVKKEIKEEIEKIEKDVEKEIEEESNKILNSLWVVGFIFLVMGLIVGIITGSILSTTSTSVNGDHINQEDAKKIVEATLKDMLFKQTQALGQTIDIKIKAIDAKDIGYFYNVSVELDNGIIKRNASVFVTKDGKYVAFGLIPAVKSFNEEKAKEEANKKLLEAYEIKNKTDKPKIIVAVMANCPFGNQIEPLIEELVNLFGDKIEIEPRYIFYSGSNPYTNEHEVAYNKSYWSLHGNYEMDEGILEYVVWKLYGTKTWIEFVNKVNEKCLNKDIISEGSEKVRECALNVAKEMGLDTNKIMEYYNKHKEEIIKQQNELTEKQNIMGSPTIIINGEIYRGPRSAEALKTIVCSAFKNPPEECNVTLNDQEVKASGSCG